ncbi:N-acetyltransferase [bacterium]|nr:N-acetyltransferase [bacterium]
MANWFFDKPLTQMEEAEEVIGAFHKNAEDGKGHTWAITLKEERELIGTCGYENLVADIRGEPGFDLGKAQ